jgi:hypothetical protein
MMDEKNCIMRNFIICSLHQLMMIKIKGEEMDGTCSMRNKNILVVKRDGKRGLNWSAVTPHSV